MPTEDGRTVTRRQLSHMVREAEFRAGDACFEAYGTPWFALPERGITAEDVARYRNVAAWWTAVAAHAALLAGVDD